MRKNRFHGTAAGCPTPGIRVGTRRRSNLPGCPREGVDVTSGLGYPQKTRGKPQNRIRRLAGLIHRFPRSHLANTTGTTCRNPREKRDSRWDRRSADILAISSSEQRFRYIPLQRIPGIPGVNEAVPRPICYVTTPAWASRLATPGTAVRER